MQDRRSRTAKKGPKKQLRRSVDEETEVESKGSALLCCGALGVYERTAGVCMYHPAAEHESSNTVREFGFYRRSITLPDDDEGGSSSQRFYVKLLHTRLRSLIY